MQILLRTASSLAKQCSEIATHIEVRAMARVSLNSNRSVDERLTEVRTNGMESIDDVLALYSTRSTIRRLIGQANNEVIDRLLSERDCLNQSEKYLITLVDEMKGQTVSSRRHRIYGGDGGGIRVGHDVGEVTKALENTESRMVTVTTGEVLDYVEVPTLNPEQIKALEGRLAGIRRRRNTLNDELAAANLKVLITLPDEVVSVLRKHQIVE